MPAIANTLLWLVVILVILFMLLRILGVVI
jgi:hypothetical protein